MTCTESHLSELIEVAELIVADNLAEIDEKYGPNSPDPQEYHHRPHSEDVVAANRLIGGVALERGKITPVEAVLLPVGGSGHDIVYNAFDKSDNERLSAMRTIEKMRRYDCFQMEHFQLVGLLILSTVVKEFQPRIIQSADPARYVTGIMCDSDLSSFGMPFEEFKPRALQYKRELKRTNGLPEMKYWDFEIAILSNHQWYTSEAAELFPHLHENIEAIKSYQTTLAVQ